MNRAFALLLAVTSTFVLGAAARAADENDAKKRPETNSSGSESAALFDKLDANHDGLITSDEVPQESRRLFDRLLRRGDKNTDGKLSRDEFTSAMSEDRPTQRGSEQPPDAGSQPGPRGGMPGGIGGRAGAGAPGGRGPFIGIAVFRALDTNGDGKLDAKEIAAAADVLKKLANKDGEVTREELLKSLPSGMGPGGAGAGRGPLGAPGTAAGGQPGQAEMNPEAAVKRMMSMFDKNGDGKLQKDEVPPRLADRFEELDTNKDGALDESELKTIVPRLMRRLQDAGPQGAAPAPAGTQRRRLMQDNTKPEAQKEEN
jgi:Ca2+-binding EF-hand superfamily protein